MSDKWWELEEPKPTRTKIKAKKIPFANHSTLEESDSLLVCDANMHSSKVSLGSFALSDDLEALGDRIECLEKQMQKVIETLTDVANILKEMNNGND